MECLDQAGVGFCHARLSIIDLNESRARQPFLTDDGEVLMAHNGEFYDFQRMRRSHRSGSSLQQQERFRDSAAALSAPRSGRDPALVAGEFAFALFDREEDCLYLVRIVSGSSPGIGR